MRGTVLLKNGDYTFFKKYEKNSRARWICSTHHGKGCRASVHTCGEKVYRFNNKHNHRPSRLPRNLMVAYDKRCDELRLEYDD